MEVRAVSKYVRISPRKVHKIIGAVKGKPVESGIQILKFMPQKAAGILEKNCPLSRCQCGSQREH